MIWIWAALGMAAWSVFCYVVGIVMGVRRERKEMEMAWRLIRDRPHSHKKPLDTPADRG